jgi:hypothetical protein
MALERPPQLGTTPDTDSYDDLKKYLPPPATVLSVHTVTAKESLADVAKLAQMEFWDYIEFIFPGCKRDPMRVNWYLHYRLNCPDMRDGKNRCFRGGEKLCLPTVKSGPGVPAPGPLEPVAPPKTRVYLRDRAVAYARRYAVTYNPQFISYTNDCTNFVSQAMLAGGWQMQGGSLDDRTSPESWWYGLAKPPEGEFSDFINWIRSIGKNRAQEHDEGYARYMASKTWASAEHFHRFLQQSGRARIVDDYMQLEPGDIVQARYTSHVHHTFFVIRKTSTDVEVANHSGREPIRWMSDVRQKISDREFLVYWRLSDTF